MTPTLHHHQLKTTRITSINSWHFVSEHADEKKNWTFIHTIDPTWLPKANKSFAADSRQTLEKANRRSINIFGKCITVKDTPFALTNAQSSGRTFVYTFAAGIA